MCLPYDLVKQVIKACHEYAHPGIRKTLEICNRKYSCAYHLKEIHQMVQSIVNKCNICGQTKGPKGLHPIILHQYRSTRLHQSVLTFVTSAEVLVLQTATHMIMFQSSFAV